MTIKITASGRRLEGLDDEDPFEKFLPKHQQRRLQFTQIEPNSLVDLLITDVVSAPSLAPSNGSIIYKALTSTNFVIEGKDSGFVVTNTEPGALSNVSTEIVPTYFEKDSFSVYTLSFVPLNYERNM